MHGGDWQDGVAVLAAWLALWKERTPQKWLYAAVLVAAGLKRCLPLIEPALRSIAFFPVDDFHRDFFSHFGPTDFMGSI